MLRPVRPVGEWRPGLSLEKRPALTTRVHMSCTLFEAAELTAALVGISPASRWLASRRLAADRQSELITSRHAVGTRSGAQNGPPSGTGPACGKIDERPQVQIRDAARVGSSLMLLPTRV
jgi:hypothetical protein